jgi:hypothetical protein
LPELHSAFAGVRSLLDDATEHATEQEMLRTIYRDLPSIDFSGRVLAEFPGEFSVCLSLESVGAILAIRIVCSRPPLGQRPSHFRRKRKCLRKPTSCGSRRSRTNQPEQGLSGSAMKTHIGPPARLSNCLDGPGRRAVIRNEVIDLYAFLFYQGGSRQLGMTFEQSYW